MLTVDVHTQILVHSYRQKSAALCTRMLSSDSTTDLRQQREQKQPKRKSDLLGKKLQEAGSSHAAEAEEQLVRFARMIAAC